MKKKASKKKIYRKTKQPQDIQARIACTAVELAQNKLTEMEIEGKVVETWAYQFDDKAGLTFWGYMACAVGGKPKERWRPEFPEPKLTVVSSTSVSLVQACYNSRTKKTEYGICSYNPNERYADRKALTIAKRYAMDKQIPPTTKMMFLNYVLNYKPERVLQVTKQDVIEAKGEVVPEETAKNKIMRGIFARIASLGLDSKRMHAYLRKVYKTKHMKDLKDEQLKECKVKLDWYAGRGKDNQMKLTDLKITLKDMTAADLKEWGGDK